MIYVPEDQLEQVEYLIHQSIQGNHILFDLDTVRQVFWQNCQYSENWNEQLAYAVEHHVERMILQPTLDGKRTYLKSLDTETMALVIKTYFNIVENNLYESSRIIH